MVDIHYAPLVSRPIGNITLFYLLVYLQIVDANNMANNFDNQYIIVSIERDLN